MTLSKPSTRIIQTIHAGLGNQLFQYAFIHYLCQQLSIDHFSILRSFFGYTKSRPFELMDILIRDDKFNKLYRLSGGKYSNLFFQLINKQPPNKVFQIFKEEDPFKLINFQHIHGSKVLFYGYFQHYSYIDSVWDEISPIIFEVCNLKKSFNPRYREKKYNVIHVRAGENANETLQNMGTLSPEYYRSFNNQINNGLENIIVTDNLNWAQKLKVVAHLPIDTQIIDNKLMNAWETLALMKDAELVISANSTLSWWGSYMCVKKGGKAILPRPWFRNWDGSTEALIWNNCSTQDSIFIDNLNETL